MAEQRPVVAWDLDSTLCDTMHRRWIIPEIKARRRTWDHYSMLCAQDTPLTGPATLMRLLGNYDHIVISARSDNARMLTETWLRTYAMPVQQVILRPAGSRLNIGIWKVSIIRKLRKAGMDIQLFVEDSAPVAARITRETGIPVLGVNPFYPDEDGIAHQDCL